MVVDKVDIARPAISKPKNDAPIGTHRYGPISPQPALERMKPKARSIHLLNSRRGLEKGQNDTNPFYRRWRELPRIVVLK
jgi:hypothetical protein